MQTIQTETELSLHLASDKIVLGYFSHDRCNVCKVLLPKIKELIENHFQKTTLLYCNIEHSPELAAQNTVFTAPAIIIFVEGKEYVRFSRNIGLDQLKQAISRPYQMLFEN